MKYMHAKTGVSVQLATPEQMTSLAWCVLAAAACCWLCARKRAERKRHAALGGKVPAALPDVEQPTAKEPPVEHSNPDQADASQACAEEPTKPLQDSKTLTSSGPVEQYKKPGQQSVVSGMLAY